MRLNKLEKTAVAALEDIKARDIVIFDVRKLTSLYDTMILATAESARQTKALASSVQEKMKAAGGRILGVEGEQSGEWVLVDCGDLIVHIMQPAVRQYYNLEELWSHTPSKAPKASAATSAGSADPAKGPGPDQRSRPRPASAAGDARARRSSVPAAGTSAGAAAAVPSASRRRAKARGDGS
jgi:ribosome-associated protein